MIGKGNRTWRPDMTDQESKDLAYYERNMLALRYADGWYYDTENNWDGWHRVLSLDGGKLTFHIPDDFDVGCLKQIQSNWDGHSTEEKWARIDKLMSGSGEGEYRLCHKCFGHGNMPATSEDDYECICGTCDGMGVVWHA